VRYGKEDIGREVELVMGFLELFLGDM